MLKSVVAAAVRAAYHVISLAPQKKTIAFLSRQAARPFDFRLIEGALAERFPDYQVRWSCVHSIGQLGVGTFLAQLALVARARVCFVDGYVPAVSIPKHHRSTCIQMWHAVGAMKRFGYQCLDTPAGRTRADAEAFRMHRGYDYVIAGMEGALPAFAEAFDVDVERILPLGLPRMDYLIDPQLEERRAADAARVRAQLGIEADDERTVIVYAPTFRKNNADSKWLAHSVRDLAHALSGKDALLVVAGHPLEAVEPALPEGRGGDVRILQGPTVEALGCADVVISDYSAVALEAAAIGKPVAFYVPDIAEYRESPGLTIDPLALFPGEAFEHAADLAQAILPADGSRYASPHAAAFIREYAANVAPGAIARIVELVSDIIAK